MQTIRPSYPVPNDREDSIMERSAQIVGFSKTRVIWIMGFLPGSDSAKAYGVSTESFTFILADYNGKVLDTFQGFGYQLPKRFKNILES